MYRNLGIIALFILMALTGCRRVNNVAYSKFVTFSDYGWDPTNVIGFYPWPFDSVNSSSDRYDLAIMVRFDPNKSPSQIPVSIRYEDEDGEIGTDTLRLILKDKSGKPLGRRSLVLQQMSATVLKGMRLNDGFSVEISSLMPREMSEGIKNLGVSLTKTYPLAEEQ